MSPGRREGHPLQGNTLEKATGANSSMQEGARSTLSEEEIASFSEHGQAMEISLLSNETPGKPEPGRKRRCAMGVGS